MASEVPLHLGSPAVWMTNAILLIGLGASAGQIRDDEHVVFYPTYGTFDEQRQAWDVAIHGNIHEPELGSSKRQVLLGQARQLLAVESNSPEAVIFNRRAGLFLVDNEGDKEIRIRLAGAVYPLDPSGDNGHFYGSLRIPANRIPDRPAVNGNRFQWIPFQAEMPDDDKRRFVGQVQLIPPVGVSIISDIDDTIKDTHVTNRQAMLTNTLLKDFRAVPGMAAIYQEAAERGVAIHYVSGSPWQLYSPLADFLTAQRFPGATYYLKYFRLNDSSWFDMLRSQTGYKTKGINQILSAYPGRTFILVGDSGEQDPEIYGEIARQHGDRIVAIYIRNVTDEQPDGDRLLTAFKDVDRQRWQLYTAGADLGAAFLKALPNR